jgi:hypothetical protein
MQRAKTQSGITREESYDPKSAIGNNEATKLKNCTAILAYTEGVGRDECVIERTRLSNTQGE